MPDYEADIENATEHLSKNDFKLKEIIKISKPCNIKPNKNYYWELIDAIISQQLSVKAASSIERRFKELFTVEFPEPSAIMEKSINDLRSAGLSGAKANYVRDLAQHIIDGKLRFDELDELPNAEIIELLTDIKGIGEWTAHMFLIFCMGRLDILPAGDLGIRKGIGRIYSFKELPTPLEIAELANKQHWHPYESVASWYVWQSLDKKSS